MVFDFYTFHTVLIQLASKGAIDPPMWKHYYLTSEGAAYLHSEILNRTLFFSALEEGGIVRYNLILQKIPAARFHGTLFW